MAFKEWEARVLSCLFKLYERGSLKGHNSFSVPEIVRLVLNCDDELGGEWSVRMFLYLLREEGVLVVNGGRDSCFRSVETFTFDVGRAYYFVKERFESSVLFGLLSDNVYELVVPKRLF